MKFSKVTILETALADWAKRDLISADLHATLSDDVTKGGVGFSFGRIVLALAMICLGFAAMTFVAANWNEIPRLARLALILGSMWAAWGIGIYMFVKGKLFLGEMGALLGSAIFGAAIMLVAQMYHIQGEATDAVHLWALGCLIAAVLTRLQAPLALAICLYIVLFFMFRWNDDTARMTLGLFLAASIVLSIWTKSRLCAHLSAVFFAIWFVWLAGDVGRFGAFYCVLAFVILGLGLFFNRWTARISLNVAAINYSLVLSGILVFMHYSQDVIWTDNSFFENTFPVGSVLYILWAVAIFTLIGLAVYASRSGRDLYYEQIALAALAVGFSVIHLLFPLAPYLPELFILIAAIWVIRMGGRLRQKATVALGVIWFIGFLIVLYFSPIGTLLGTSLFFALVGIIMIGLVFLLPRVWNPAGEKT